MEKKYTVEVQSLYGYVSPNDILDKCNNLIKSGITDIEFTGEDVCGYTYDFNGVVIHYSDVIRLVVSKCKGITKLNIGKLNPSSAEVEKVIDVVCEYPGLFHPLYLSVNSGSDKVLKLMGCVYSVNRIRDIYKYFPGIEFVWHIIIGFPGETEEDFKETYDLMEELKPIDTVISLYDDLYINRKERLTTLQTTINEFYKCTDKEAKETLDEFRTTNTKFIQYELWKDCPNACPFCYNIGQPTEDNKVERMVYVMNLLKSEELSNYNTIGFIGGELFDTRILTDIEQDTFVQLMELSANLVLSGSIDRVYVTSNLIYEDRSLLDRVLTILKNKGTLTHYGICTSWDYKYRFRTEQDRVYWENNMGFIRKNFPEVMLHIEIIVTQALIDAVMDGKLDLTMFEKQYGASVDFMAPNAGYNYASKKDFSKHIPDFFPRRDDFIEFLYKFALENKVINLNSLFKRELQCDCIYIKHNGNQYKITNRVKSLVPFPCDIPRLTGYSDSDVFMKNDVKEIREMVL